jgi:hypothetical protein
MKTLIFALGAGGLDIALRADSNSVLRENGAWARRQSFDNSAGQRVTNGGRCGPIETQPDSEL